MKLRRRESIYLLLILLAALLLRVVDLGSNPPAVFRDEAEKGYTAWCLLELGGYCDFQPDENGSAHIVFRRWPVFVNVMGVETSAIYQYLDIPFVAMGGLNPWTTRLPAALAGALTVLLSFVLTRRFFDSKHALLVALLLAVSPWHIVFSRWALQGIFIPLFICWGLIWFLKGIQDERKELFVWLSAFPFALAFYAYSGARPFIPLFLLVIVFVYRRPIWQRRWHFFAGFAFFLALSLPILFFSLSAAGGARLERVSIFSDDLSPLQTLLTFTRNYLAHYSPNFLFIGGDSVSRHSVAGFGQLYLAEAPFLVWGLVRALRRRSAADQLLLGWFLLFPVSAALTREGIPHALRTIFALPMPQILAAIGLREAWALAKKRAVKLEPQRVVLNRGYLRAVRIFVCLVYFSFVTLFSVDLFAFYPRYSAPDWQYGVKESLELANTLRGPDAMIAVSGRITFAHYLILYYRRIPPTELRDRGLEAIPYALLPPLSDYGAIWSEFPKGTMLIALPDDRVPGNPIAAIPLPDERPPLPGEELAAPPAMLLYRR
ncbi:MAG: glycosyltransferase family 39 protein [bacterium]